jgi:TatD DNase family protein
VIFDSHCHLDPQTYGGDAGVDEVVATAVAAGVTRMLTVGSGYGDGTAARAVDVAKRHPGVVWASVGLHPHDADLLDDELVAKLTNLAKEPEVVAYGEIGLDYYYDNVPRSVQRTAFVRQIHMALGLNLPIIIHDRESKGECLETLKGEGAFAGAGVLYHCYGGDVEHMHEVVEAGGFISIPGVVTFKKAQDTQDAAKACPSSRLLVETDSPFLTPAPLRGRRNEPCHVALTLEAVALLRGVPTMELAKITTDNTLAFFGIAKESAQINL